MRNPARVPFLRSSVLRVLHLCIIRPIFCGLLTSSQPKPPENEKAKIRIFRMAKSHVSAFFKLEAAMTETNKQNGSDERL
jgi:hypothetical protein